MGPNDQPVFIFTDQHERARFAVTLQNDGAPSLNLIGPGGRSHAVLSPNTLAFKDPGPQPRTVSTRLFGHVGQEAGEVVFLASPRETFAIDSATMSILLSELEQDTHVD